MITQATFARDPRVRAWILATTTKGFCEACANQAPFYTADSSPFLEVHHVKMLPMAVPTKSRTPSRFVQIATVAFIIQPIGNPL